MLEGIPEKAVRWAICVLSVNRGANLRLPHHHKGIRWIVTQQDRPLLNYRGGRALKRWTGNTTQWASSAHPRSTPQNALLYEQRCVFALLIMPIHSLARSYCLSKHSGRSLLSTCGEFEKKSPSIDNRWTYWRGISARRNTAPHCLFNT